LLKNKFFCAQSQYQQLSQQSGKEIHKISVDLLFVLLIILINSYVSAIELGLSKFVVFGFFISCSFYCERVQEGK